MHTKPLSLRRRQLLLAGFGAATLAACGGGGDVAPSAAGPENAAHAAGGALRVPAEVDPHHAVMLASPTVDYKVGWSALAVQAQMIRELLTTVDVVYLVNTDAADDPAGGDVAALRNALATLGVPGGTIDARVHFHKVPHADLWVRDYGGIFLTNGRGALEVVDFDFDGYGYNPYASDEIRAVYDYDNDLSVRAAAALGLPVRRSPLVAEGGNLHFNGRGMVVAVETSLRQRNPGWTDAAIDMELRRVFGVQRVIRLPRGLATDAHTVLQSPYLIGGEPVYNVGVNHVDEMIAWVDDRTVLLPEVTAADLAAAQAAGDPTAQITHDALQQAYQVLCAVTDEDGRPLDIVRVPDPGAIVIEIQPEDGIYGFIAALDHHPVHRLVGAERFAAREPVKYALAASYMNFVVSNGVVLIPAFYKPGRDPALAAKDAAFKAIVEARYPGRRVMQIDVDALTVGGGGMHCISQQIPMARDRTAA
jgi:agmatine deiminase